MPDSAFTDLVAELSTRLAGLAASRVGPEIDSALEEILGYLGTDRISLLELSDDDASIFVAHSRIRSGAEGVRPALGQSAARTWYAPKLRAGDVVRLDRVPDDLPAAAREERDHAVRFASRSHLAVPLSIAGRWVCALATDTCLDDRSWSDATVQELRVLGQLLANERHRARLELELRERLAELRRLEDRLRAENEYLREEIDIEAGFESIVGRSAALRHVRELAVQVAETPASVLLLGETGTGKDLIGRAIHSRSSRRERAFVRVNCAALPASLVESELFGYEKGAFTGAAASKPGRFELADGGTLFLDEVGELPREVQAKLLRVLQDGEFERLGAVQTRKVDVRIVAATNRDLIAAMSEGRFREDLFYRIAAFPSTCRRCGITPRTSAVRLGFVHRRGRSSDGASTGFPRRPWRRCAAIRGRATCASSGT